MGWRPGVVVGCGLALLGPALGCTEFADGDDMLVEGEDSPPGQDATGSSNDWSCLSGVIGRNTSLTPTDRDQPFTFSVEVTGDGGTMPRNLAARACANLDPECMTPVAPPSGFGSDGRVELELFQGFFGFIEVTSDDTVPTLFFLPEILTGDTVGPPLRLISSAALQTIARLNDVEIDTARGHMALIVEDCAGARASDVKLTNDKGGVGFYYLSGIPSQTIAQTAADGVGGFVNLLPGAVSVRAELAADLREIAAKSMYVRPGWMTASVISPLVSPSGVR
jgi:hypothetical protein